MTCTKHTELTPTVARINAQLASGSAAKVRIGSLAIGKVLCLHYLRKGRACSMEGGVLTIN